MFAVIYIPDFFLQAQLRDPHDTKPTALVKTAKKSNDSKARIMALNQAARDLQVETGMTAAQGQARCGELRILHPSEEAEAEAQRILLELSVSCSRDFEETGLGICTLDLMGTRCGDEWELGWKLVEELAKTSSLRAQIGFAETPDLALMVAQQADPVRSIAGESDDEFLQQLPIEALNPPPDITMVLTLWGIHTIGDFLALPQGDVAERLGPDALDLWERVSGKKSRLLRLVRPPEDFSQTVDFDHEVDTLEPLLFMMRRVLETICARLAAAWLTAGEIRLALHFARGGGYERAFRVPDPTTEVELLFRMLHAHLEDFEAKAPIITVRLEALPARGAKRQFHLFESGLRDPNRFAETLARLEGLLGSERVGIPEMLDCHRPDAFRMRPFQEAITDQKSNAPKPEKSFRLGLPLRRFRPPIFANVAVSSTDQRPIQISSVRVKGAIADCRGPWAISGDWWAKESRWSRKEWDVEMAGGGLYRLACEGKDEWKVEGIYG